MTAFTPIAAVRRAVRWHLDKVGPGGRNPPFIQDPTTRLINRQRHGQGQRWATPTPCGNAPMSNEPTPWGMWQNYVYWREGGLATHSGSNGETELRPSRSTARRTFCLSSRINRLSCRHGTARWWTLCNSTCIVYSLSAVASRKKMCQLQHGLLN